MSSEITSAREDYIIINNDHACNKEKPTLLIKWLKATLSCFWWYKTDTKNASGWSILVVILLTIVWSNKLCSVAVQFTSPLSANGYITSFWPSSRDFTFCLPFVFSWEVALFLLLRPAEHICCKSGRPLMLEVPFWSWMILVASGVFPQSLLGFISGPFLPLAVPGWIVLPRSPRARLGVVKGALLTWKDFAGPKLLPV